MFLFFLLYFLYTCNRGSGGRGMRGRLDNGINARIKEGNEPRKIVTYFDFLGQKKREEIWKIIKYSKNITHVYFFIII